MSFYRDLFVRHFREWVGAACDAWGYSQPREEFFHRVLGRLTDPIVDWIGYGIHAELVVEDGVQFNLVENPSGKGPYKWFSKRTGAAEPQCNWEYYVQVAHFLRLWQPCRMVNSRLTFEDELMDLTVRRNGQILWCIEVKERSHQLERLLMKLGSLGTEGVNLHSPDRGNDPLRKAKYLVNHKPQLFSAVAIDLTRDFRVTYPRETAFALLVARPPIETLRAPPPPPLQK